MDPHRAQRVSEALREELAELVEYELTDPRLSGATVTSVHVTPDLRHAHVTVSSKSIEQTLEALDHARNYLRRELAARLSLFRVPELHFQAASVDDPVDRVEELLERVRKNRRRSSEPRPAGEKDQNFPPK